MKRLRRWLRRNRGRAPASRPTVLGFVRALGVYAVVVSLFASPAVAYYDQPGINGVASRLAAKNVTVRCLESEAENDEDAVIGFQGAEAYVEGWIDYYTGRWRPKSYAVFGFPHCSNLTRWMSDQDLSGVRLNDFAWSFLVLVHESGHLRGARWSGDEARTQCWAMQHAQSAANMIGVSKEAWPLLWWALTEIHKNQLSESYQLQGCRVYGTPLTP